jgi:hypothetical protein
MPLIFGDFRFDNFAASVVWVATTQNARVCNNKLEKHLKKVRSFLGSRVRIKKHFSIMEPPYELKIGGKSIKIGI